MKRTTKMKPGVVTQTQPLGRLRPQEGHLAVLTTGATAALQTCWIQVPGGALNFSYVTQVILLYTRKNTSFEVKMPYCLDSKVYFFSFVFLQWISFYVNTCTITKVYACFVASTFQSSFYTYNLTITSRDKYPYCPTFYN